MSGIEGNGQTVRGITPTLRLPPGTEAQVSEIGLAFARALVPGAARGPEELARVLVELGRLPAAAQSAVLALVAQGRAEANPVEAVRARIAEAFPPGSLRRNQLAEALALRHGLDPARLSRTALESVVAQALAKIAPIRPTPRPPIQDVLEPSPSFGPFVASSETPGGSGATAVAEVAPQPLPPPVSPQFKPDVTPRAPVAEAPAPAPPPQVWVPPPSGGGGGGGLKGLFKKLKKFLGFVLGIDLTKKVWAKVKNKVKALLPYIAMILRIIPLGWTQILATVIQIYLAAKAKNIMGVVAAVVSFVPAVGAYLSSVGLNTAAQVLTKVAEVAKYASQAMEAYSKIKRGDWLGGLAGIAGAAAGVVGDISEEAASTLRDWSKDLNTWGDRLSSGMQAINAARRGDFLGAFGVGANLAADLDLLPTDDKGTFTKVAGVAKQVGAIQTAIRKGDWTEAAEALSGLADKYGEPELKTVAKTVEKLVTVQQMVKKKDYLGAASIVLRVAGQYPLSDETKTSLQQMAGRLQAAGQALARGRSGDFGGAAKELWKIGLSIEWDKETRKELQKAANTFTRGLAVHDALKSGDLAKATELLGDVVSLFSEEAATPEALRKLARRLQDATDLRDAIRKGDHSKAADILGEILKRETGGDAGSGRGGQDTEGGSGEGAESGQGDAPATLGAFASATSDAQASAAPPRTLDSAVEEVVQLLNVWTRTPDGRRILEIIRSLPESQVNAFLTELKVRGYLQKLFDGVQGEEYQELVRLLVADGDRAVLDESGLPMMLAGYTVPVGPVDPKKVAREVSQDVASQLGLPWPLDSQNLTPEEATKLEELGQDKSFLESLRDKAQSLTFSEAAHLGLDVLGVVPGIGEAADVANAVWYVAEGNYLDAGLSLISVIPLVGDAIGKGGKLATRLGGDAAKKKVLDALESVDVIKFLDQFKSHPKLGPYVAKIQEAVQKWIDELKATSKTAPEPPTIGGRKPINSQYAGKTYPPEKLPPEVRAKYPKSVRFTADGFPDFSPYATHTVQIKVTGDYAGDFKAANEAAGLTRTPKGYTWHHHQDGKTMQLVPTDLHQAVRHTGGVAVKNQ